MSLRRLSEVELAIEYFYSRTYRAQYVLRNGTVGLVAGVGFHLGLLTIPQAIVWVAAFLASEAIIWLWWRRLEPQLGTLSDRAARAGQWQMIFFSALSTTAASAPFLFQTPPSHDAAMLAILFLAGVIMLIAAQQTMTRHMFLWTTPLPAIALMKNLMVFGTGADAWIMAGLGLCFVANARKLQLSNAKGEEQLIQNQLKAQQANAAKREFLATVSHEIRTPLNGMLGMAQAMARETMSPPQTERLDVIRRSGAALEALLNDVLDLSKIEAGKLELEAADFDLGDLLRSAADPFLAKAQDKGLALLIDAEAAPGHVRGDPNRIRQIVANLISNAVKFTARGDIRVTAARTAQGIEIIVSDTGIGMSREAADRVFERFAQAEANTPRVYGGTGLGLAICRDLAELMGGSIALSSRPGSGSRFEVRLPLPQVATPSDAAAVEAPAEAGALGRLRVLVAEDNATNQLVLQHLLAAMGDLQVAIVADGAAALDAWDRSAWDLILMDINMPVLDGVAATQELRRREAAADRPHTPVIALTANAMSHQIEEYLSAGMDGVVSKPIHAPALLAAMAEVLAGPHGASALSADGRAA